MVPTLAQLVPPVTADEVKAVLLSTLSGIGPVQQIGQGLGTLVISGGPLGSYDVVVEVTTPGGLGAAAFEYSLDGGKTFAGPFTVPASGVFAASGTGMTFTFASTFSTGDQYLAKTIFPVFPVTDWESGSGGRTLVEGESATVADFAGNLLGEIAGGGLVDYASAAWLPLLSHELYENDQFQPVVAQGLLTVSLASTASAKTFAANQLVVANAPGSGSNVFAYSNVAGFTINPGQTLQVPFAAIAPGSLYNLQNNTVATQQSPTAGLTVSNPAPGTSAVAHVGSGGGTITVGGNPNANYSVVVKVTSTGGLGAGVVQVSLDGGSNFASPLTIPAGGTYVVVQLDGATATGLLLTFTGSFTSGDSYSFTSYAQWITVPGQDLESVQALAARDKNKWTGLGLGGGTDATFDYLARSTPSGGSEVTRTSADPDTFNPGQVDLTVAGYNGPVSSSSLAAITTYVAQRTGLCVKSTVINATTQSVPVVATVFVPATSLAAVQAAISAAFAQLAASTPIGGVVFWSDIVEALDQKQAGVRNVEVQVPAQDAETQLASGAVPVFALTITYQLI